ncbi:MAG TPA: hypothetical protein VMY39_06985, partial [Planctomycetota bacterium]|nr:hypothetical protein [Planctomycetota bacterium]
MKRPTVVDFETDPIAPRPTYPPRPVSVSVWEAGRKPEFWAWGHPSGNNCTKVQATDRLRDVWRGSAGVLCHEAKFDLDVAETHLGLAPPPWDRVHDTIPLLFLADPNAESLSLKPSAERYCDWAQDDQTELREWILSNVPEAKGKPTKWEAWIGRLPGDLAVKRATGDVRRTRALCDVFHVPSAAYDRERRLMPVLLRMERRGVPVDVAGLEADVAQGARCMARIDRWIR